MSLKSVIGKLGKGAILSRETLEDMAGIPDKIINKTLEKVDYNDAKNWTEKALGVRLTKKAGIIGALGVGAYVLGSSAMEQNRISSVGEVTADEVADSTNRSRSYQLMSDIEEMQNNEYFASAFGEENLSNSQKGVEPGIVFALHNLRS